MSRRLNAVLMMTEENPAGREYLKACLAADVVPSAIIVESSEAARRAFEYNTRRMGGLYAPPTTAELVETRAIPVYLTTRHMSPHIAALLERLAPDTVVAGGVGGILKKDLLSIPPRGFIGCHPGLLPRMRGSSPIAYAVLDDYPVGASCFVMDEGIDTGPVIYTERLPIHRDDTYEAIEARMLVHCGLVLAKGLERLKDAGFSPTPQRAEDGITRKQVSAELLEAVRVKLSAGTYACYEGQGLSVSAAADGRR